MLPQTPWFVRLNRPSRPRLRLFAFPYAGGSASLFREWARWMGDQVELVGMQLPGRERRFNDSLIKHVEVAVDGLYGEITKCRDLPFSFFGHSNGATLAFELAGKLEREGTCSPQWLIVSGRKSPDRIESYKKTKGLSDELFVQQLRELEGTPAAILDDPQMLEVLLPMLRADFEMTENYRYVARTPLKCSMAAFGGTRDRYVSEQDVEAWSAHTSGSFMTRLFDGGHFFLHDRQSDVVDAVLRVLSGNFAAMASDG